MCLVISGDESFDSIINIVENSLNGYKQSPVPEVKYFDEPLEINKRYIEDMCDVSEASYIFGFKLAPILSARECAFAANSPFIFCSISSLLPLYETA